MRSNLQLLLLLLFSGSAAFAQLTVRNNAYIYVTDEVVYVEDDVNIKESTAAVYLRDEAQLIQGAGTTGNAGIGQLSVFQSGTVHNWAYNYWASPVGHVDVDANGNSAFRANSVLYDWTGNIVPSLNAITSTQASFTAGVDGTASPLAIASYWLWTFNPGVLYSEWDSVGALNNLDAGSGFTMKGSTGAPSQLYDFRGKPNSGTINTAVLTGQYTLVGNPYPSALDAVDYIHDAVNSTLITGTLFFWEQDLGVSSHLLNQYIGGYATYTISSDGLIESFVPAVFNTVNNDGTFGTGGSSSTSGKAVHRYIPIGQGFMVEGSANGNVRTMNSHREYYKQTDPDSEFFKTGANTQNKGTGTINELNYNEDGFQIVGSEYKRFRLNVDFNLEHTRQLLHNFHNTASDGFDYGLESSNKNPLGNDAYYILDETAFITQAHAFDVDLRIPLVVSIEEAMPLKVRLLDVQNFEDYAIYLHDIETDQYYDLDALDFDVNLEAGTYSDRFEVTFKYTGPNEDPQIVNTEVETGDFVVFQNNTNAQLTLVNPKALNITSVVIYDITGKKIMENVNMNTNTRYNVSTRHLSDGAYAVQITFKDQESLSKKIIISNK